MAHNDMAKWIFQKEGRCLVFSGVQILADIVGRAKFERHFRKRPRFATDRNAASLAGPALASGKISSMPFRANIGIIPVDKSPSQKRTCPPSQKQTCPSSRPGMASESPDVAIFSYIIRM